MFDTYFTTIKTVLTIAYKIVVALKDKLLKATALFIFDFLRYSNGYYRS